MKILPVELIREADAYTILHEPIAPIDLMERAAAECFYWMLANIPADLPVRVFCGSGNNGGDGFAIARMLAGKGYKPEVFLVGDPGNLSPSCRINYERLQDCPCRILVTESELPPISKTDLVIDALLGSGLTREPEGLHADLIRHINESHALVVAIDVPSGLFCDDAHPGADRSIHASKQPAIIHADYTLTFAPPKYSFFFAENDPCVGNWQLLDIGIMQEFLDNAVVSNFYIDAALCRNILRKRSKFSHKGTYGHALLICGARGKMGAAVLAAHACMRSGPGLVTLHTPGEGITILQTAVPEVMISADESADIFSSLPDLQKYSTIAIGPGIGMHEQTSRALKLLIQESPGPLIFDADAINILAENKTWLGFIRPESIFTPHPKEFERLVGKSRNDFERNRIQREFSLKYNAFVVLKGAHTAITTPEGACYFNSTGNPGMATGGSGDVLTGIIAGIRAQGYTAPESVLLGVYIHGLAGDLALAAVGYESLIANDIIDNLGKAFQSLYGKL